MEYPITLEGFEDQELKLVSSFWSGYKIFAKGKPAPKGNKRGDFMLTRNDGQGIIATMKSQALGFDVPLLIIEEKTINLVEPLMWYQWVWSGIPAILVFAGGALGAFAGIMAFAINLRIFRTKLDAFLKYVITGMISLGTFVIYLVAAFALAYLLRG